MRMDFSARAKNLFALGVNEILGLDPMDLVGHEVFG